MNVTIARNSVSQAAAEYLVAAAVRVASDIGTPMVIAIVDESGILKSFVRMDGAPLLSVEVAKDKAYTAAAFGIPTHGWFDFIKNDPPLLNGIVKMPRLIVFGGGYPITVDAAVIGAIGVSGGHYSQDMQVAEAALAAFADLQGSLPSD